MRLAMHVAQLVLEAARERSLQIGNQLGASEFDFGRRAEEKMTGRKGSRRR